MSSKAGVAAVDRAFTILDTFKTEGAVLTLAEISKGTGLYKSTILRLMGSLEQFGYIRQLQTGSYQLGPKLAELASVFQDAFGLRDFVLPALENLVGETNEGASFFIRDGAEQVCLFRVDGRHTIRDHHIRVGCQWDLNSGATAKVLNKFEGVSVSEVTLKNYIMPSFGEKHEEMAALAAPVFGVNNVLVGAMSISGPRSRFDDDTVKSYSEKCIEESAKLSITLGASMKHFNQLIAEVGTLKS